jgi:gamma-glutamyltranspeptidase/glutathione hydrolase
LCACETAVSDKPPRHGERSALPAPSPALSAPGPRSNASAKPTEAEPPAAVKAVREPDPGVQLTAGGKGVALGQYGVVSSVEDQATRAGVDILEQGGNAVDAAVAVAYALSVTHPSAASLGGGGFALIAHNGDVFAVDFRETAPGGLKRQAFDKMIDDGGAGPVSVGIPGMVAGLSLMHEKLGCLERAQLMAPAIKLAAEGYKLSLRQHQSLTWNWRKLRTQREFVLRFADATGRKPALPGRKLKRQKLAETLKTIAQAGARAFYAGSLTQGLVEPLQDATATTVDDFANYRAKLREPLSVYYRGLQVVSMPPPSAGGVALTQTLLMLEKLKAFEPAQDSSAALHLLIEAAKRAHVERRFGVIDPDAVSEQQRLSNRTRWLAADTWLKEHPISLTQATPSRALHPLFDAEPESENTTHFSVIDKNGMAVSCTITLSAAFGAKVLSPTTGVIFNNAVASFSAVGSNQPAGGRRTTSSMSPTLVYFGDKLGLILGSPGGDTIPNTVVQVLRNVVDYGMSIDQAVNAPRIHHGFIPDEVRIERSRPISKQTLAALTKLGHSFSKTRYAIGDANNILIKDGVAYGFADPREGGLALAAKESENRPRQE